MNVSFKIPQKPNVRFMIPLIPLLLWSPKLVNQNPPQVYKEQTMVRRRAECRSELHSASKAKPLQGHCTPIFSPDVKGWERFELKMNWVA